jgi:hypothetical protein
MSNISAKPSGSCIVGVPWNVVEGVYVGTGHFSYQAILLTVGTREGEIVGYIADDLLPRVVCWS